MNGYRNGGGRTAGMAEGYEMTEQAPTPIAKPLTDYLPASLVMTLLSAAFGVGTDAAVQAVKARGT